MRALWVLARMRVLDVTRSTGGMLAFFGLPLLILAMLALVFAHGHPFETKTVCVVATPAEFESIRAALGERAELWLSPETDELVARRKLEVRAAEAVVVLRAQQRPEVLVGPRAAIWGRGLSTLLPGASVTQVPMSQRGYLFYLFPGLLGSSVMFAGLYGMGYAMARYRQNWFLKKLSTTPLSQGTFVLAQVLGRACLVLVQIVLLLGAAWLGFALPVPLVSALSAGLVTLLGLLVFCGIGFALACLIRAEAVLNDVISALSLPIVLFSGMFFPIQVLPAPLFQLCSVLPSTLLVDAARATLLYGASLASVAPALLGLTAWGGAAFALSLRVFRWHD
ncbi:MAG: ABC transporter permease [Polyangiaceae bacterium]